MSSSALPARFAIASLSLGDCRYHTLEDKLRAGAAAGFRRFELFVADFEQFVEVECGHASKKSEDRQGARLAAATQLAGLARELDISFNCIQPLRDVEGILDAEKRAQKFQEVASYFPICDILDIDLILCCSSVDSSSSDEISVISKDLVEVADMATEWQRCHGGRLIRIGYEGLSWGAHVNTCSQAFACVEHNPRPNLGLIIDSFNSFAREYADPYNATTGLQRSADASAAYLSQHLQRLVSTVPGSKIFLFQTADASMPPSHLATPPSPSSGIPRLQPWSRNCRLFPMEDTHGAYLPIVDYVKGVLATGYQGDISLEVFNASLQERTTAVPKEHAQRAYTSLERLAFKLRDEAKQCIEPVQSGCVNRMTSGLGNASGPAPRLVEVSF